MTDNDKKRFMSHLSLLAENFGKEPSKALAKLYFEGLKDLSIEQVEQAVTRAALELKFFPKPVEIRELAGASLPNLEDRALMAWHDAWAAAGRVGQYRSVQFEDRVTMATIDRMGGWPSFCRPEQEEQWHRREFLELYRAMAGFEVDAPKLLVGIIEGENGARFAEFTPRPALIRPTVPQIGPGSQRDRLKA